MNNIIKLFLEDQEAKPNTYKALVSDCKHLDEYLSANQKQLFSIIGKEEAQAYILYLSSNYAPRTVKRRICTLRKLYDWCKVKGYLPKELKIDIKESIISPERHFAETKEISLLYQSCCNIFEDDSFAVARAKAECLLIILCGFKASELTELTLNDINDDLNTIHYMDELNRRRIRLVRFDLIKETFNKYLKKREDLIREGNGKNNFLFITARCENVSTNIIHSDFNTIRELAAVSISASSVRSSCIKYYYSQLTDDVLISKLFNISENWVCSIQNQKTKDNKATRR